MHIGAAAAWRKVSQSKCAATAACCIICGALNYFFALVKLGFVPTAGVSVIGNGFVGAKESVGTTLSGQGFFREVLAVSHSTALGDMFDLTLWLVAGWWLPGGDAWRSRTTHQDRL